MVAAQCDNAVKIYGLKRFSCQAPCSKKKKKKKKELVMNPRGTFIRLVGTVSYPGRVLVVVVVVFRLHDEFILLPC